MIIFIYLVMSALFDAKTRDLYLSARQSEQVFIQNYARSLLMAAKRMSLRVNMLRDIYLSINGGICIF